MKHKNNPVTPSSWRPIKPRKIGNPVSKVTQVAGRRIGGAQRSEFARQQKRRDGRR
jgi:hypothetical protein